jgi:hypothetical protein
MRSIECTQCKKNTGCVILAQYLNRPIDEAYICKPCYDEGYRCWILIDGTFIVSIEQPKFRYSRRADLYWDEGSNVTEDNTLPRTYPRPYQPIQDPQAQAISQAQAIIDMLEDTIKEKREEHIKALKHYVNLSKDLKENVTRYDMFDSIEEEDAEGEWIRYSDVEELLNKKAE